MALATPNTKGHFIPDTAALTDEEQALLDGLGLKLPNGSAIHYVNIRAMWRHSPHRFIRCAAYAHAWGVGEKTVARVVRAIAAVEGKTAITAYENGRKVGLRIVSSGQVADMRHTSASHVCTTHIPNGPQVTPNGPGAVSSTVQEPLGQRSTDRSIDEYINEFIDESLDEQDLRREVSRPIDAGVRKFLIGEAVRLYDQAQTIHGGPLTDQATISNLLQQSAGMDDRDVADACADALYANNAWAWSCSSASTRTAGEAISAALIGELYSPEPGVSCTPDAGEGFRWDDEVRTYVSQEIGWTVEQVITDTPPAPVEAPAALNKENLPVASSSLSEAVLGATESVQSSEHVLACQSAERNSSPVIAALLSEQPTQRETHESEEERHRRNVANAQRQIAQLRAKYPDSFKSPANRYGLPAEPEFTPQF